MSTLRVNTLQNTSTTDGGISIDTSGHVTVDGVAYPSAGSLSGRNRIINGDMRIDQRNAGGSVADMRSTYTLDRWVGRGQSGGGVQSCIQSSTAPAGFTRSALITTTTSATPSAGHPYRFEQFVEGFNFADLAWGTANAQSITVSFWVRSSLTGTFGFSVSNSAANRSYVGQYTVNAANTFEYKTVTIAGDTSGTWLADNGIGVRLAFDTGSGSDSETTAGAWTAAFAVRSSGNVRLIATNGATFYITGVQLEAGTVATPFERRSYGQELALCQRYFFSARQGITAIANAGYGGGTVAFAGVVFPVPMRVAPTSAPTAVMQLDYPGVTNYTQSSAYAAGSFEPGGGLVEMQNFTGLSTGVLLFVRQTSGQIQFNAEL